MNPFARISRSPTLNDIKSLLDEEIIGGGILFPEWFRSNFPYKSPSYTRTLSLLVPPKLLRVLKSTKSSLIKCVSAISIYHVHELLES